MFPSTNVTFGGASRRAASSSSGTTSTPTTSRTSGASASASVPAPVPASSARSTPGARRDRAGCAFLRYPLEQPSDLRSRRQAELVAAEEGVHRLARARGFNRRNQLWPFEEDESIGRPRLGHTAETVDRSRGIVGGRLGGEECARVTARLDGHGQSPHILAERGNEAVPRGIQAIDPCVERAAQRCKQIELGEQAKTVSREALELGEHALACRASDESRVVDDQTARHRRDGEVELVGEPHRAHEAKRIVLEHRLGHRANFAQLQILPPAARIEVLTAGDR